MLCHTNDIEMAQIRKTKTNSGAIAIQAVTYKNRKTIVLKHFGSGKTKGEENTLIEDAQQWLEKYTGQPSLFSNKEEDRLLHLGVNRCAGMRYSCAHIVLTEILKHMGFTELKNRLLMDLVIMRIFEPSSKVRTIELLARYFGITYTERTLYRELPKLLPYKEKAQETAVSFARKQLRSDLSFVLYDVTTLFFESTRTDDLRRHGFSKDNKPAQPQIVIGLLVNADGFPLRYEIFAGNTFEGKTILPVLRAFHNTYKTQTCCVVADAAMISSKNINELKKEGLQYIVGARVANMSPDIIDKITTALKDQRDGASIRIAMPDGDLIASFSSSRYRKDKIEMDRQIAKAKALVEAQEPGKRAKFVISTLKAYSLNDKLIEKTKLLLGIKGYCTNIPQDKMSDAQIIEHYRNLWRVEQAFRMSKNDLVARPIFHHKIDSINAHLIICFIAQAVGKYIELKTGLSLRRIVDLLKQVQDARIINTRTNEEILLPALLTDNIKNVLTKLDVSY